MRGELAQTFSWPAGMCLKCPMVSLLLVQVTVNQKILYTVPNPTFELCISMQDVYFYSILHPRMHWGRQFHPAGLEIQRMSFPDFPSAPQNVTCENATSSTMDISWTKPLFDGGSPIMGYVVEECSRLIADEENLDWIMGARITGDDIFNYTVADLEEGRQYSFRVKAQNRAGYGKTSDETPFATAIDARGL